jgi:WD40 repeat protein
VLPFSEPGMTTAFYVSTLSGDGTHVVLSGQSEGAHVRIYDVASAQAVSPDLKHRAFNHVSAAAFSPDGQTLLTGCGDHTARLWSVAEGRPLGGPLTHPTSVSAVAFAPDGHHFATAQRGGLIRLWALPAGNPRDYRLPLGSSSWVRLSRDGRFLLPSGISHNACELPSTQVIDLVTGKRAGPPLAAHGLILDAAFSPDGLQVAAAVSRTTSSQERRQHPGRQLGQLLLWEWRTGKLQHEPLQLTSEPRKLDYSPDGRQLAVLSAEGELTVVDPITGNIRQWPAHRPHRGNNNHSNGAVRFSPDSRRLLTFDTATNGVSIWDAATCQPGPGLKHDARCWDVQFSPDGRLVATAGEDGQACVWNLATGEQLANLVHPDWTYRTAFSPDGKYLLTAGRDGMARLWDWRAGRQLHTFEHEHEVQAVAFTPDGRHVLSASRDGELRIWEWRTGKLVCSPFVLEGPGQSLAVTPDGRWVACGGQMKHALSVFYLDGWLAPSALAADDLCLWAEIVSGRRIENGGGVSNLTAEEWLQGWLQFRVRHPDRPTLATVQ